MLEENVRLQLRFPKSFVENAQKKAASLGISLKQLIFLRLGKDVEDVVTTPANINSSSGENLSAKRIKALAEPANIATLSMDEIRAIGREIFNRSATQKRE